MAVQTEQGHGTHNREDGMAQLHEDVNDTKGVNGDPSSATNGATEAALATLAANCRAWPAVPVADRITLLKEVRESVLPVAQAWVGEASRRKVITPGSPLEGAEWFTGPYALINYCDALIDTLSHIEGKRHLASLPIRDLPGGQIAVQVLPRSIWDRLLLSGVRAEVWMKPGVTRENLAQHTGATYDGRAHQEGKLALVLGAGNIAAIAPLDALHKLFVENQVVLLKMNPVNDYLIEFFERVFRPLIQRGLLRIIKGDAALGAYLTTHPAVEEIHITGSQATHDRIVWGEGVEPANNKSAKTPKNGRRITSELGAVCPTIVVPGPWTKADLAFQSENLASQKMQNGGFNCIASQVLVLPKDWDRKADFLAQLGRTLADAPTCASYYPGTPERLDTFAKAGQSGSGADARCHLIRFNAGQAPGIESNEVFGPALGVTELPSPDAERFLMNAIDYANRHLHGMLGANILIHPQTLRAIGRRRFDELIATLRYGYIAVNAWTGFGFIIPATPWGAFPGHTLEDVQSGIGFVHNTMLFDQPERTVLEAPFKPYPRNLMSLSFTMLPRPPWFITNRRAHDIGRLVTAFMHRPAWGKLPRIFYHALRG